MDLSKIILVARVGAPHGVRGLLRLQPFLDSPALLPKFKQYYLQFPHQPWQIAPEFSFSKKGENFFIHFKGFDQPESAGLKFTHALLGVARDELPALPKGQYYWEDLIGLKVINQQGQSLGVVDYLFATPAHDVVVVKNDQKEILIPYVWGRFIINVDLNAGVMSVDWES